MAPAIEVSNLKKKYGVNVAVQDLSLTVPNGMLFGFLGPNGSGKSTTIGCLTGLLAPTAGEIRVLGQALHDGNLAIKRRGHAGDTWAL
jgi:ABC-2 type transport system ATP-binding protein